MSTGEIAPNAPASSPPKTGDPTLSNRTPAWSMTFLVMALYVINYADKAALGIIAQPLSRELGLTASQIGMVGSLFFLTFTIGSFGAGALNAWISLRWSLLLLAAVWSVVMLPLVVSASLVALLVCRMLLGFAEGPSSALMHTATYSWHAPDRRGLPSSMLMASASLAKIFLAPALTFVTLKFGWRETLVLLSVLGVIWMIVWFTRWAEGPFLARSSKAGTAGITESEPRVPWRRILLSPTFISCGFLIMVVYGLTAIALTFLPSYFEIGLGFSSLQAGSLFAVPSVLALVFMLTSGWLTDRMLQRGKSSRQVRIALPCIGVVIASLVLILLPVFTLPALAVAVLSVAYGLAVQTIPLLNSAISELCPPRQTAGTMGIFLGAMAVGGLIAPYATGWLVDHAATALEGYTRAFQIVGVVGAITAVGALAFANPGRDRVSIRGH